MFGLLDLVKMAGAAVLAGALAYTVGHWRGDSAGYDRRVAQVAAASAKAELERRNDDRKLRAMSDYDLCVVGLAGRGLLTNACEQLRGLDEE